MSGRHGAHRCWHCWSCWRHRLAGAAEFAADVLDDWVWW